MKVKYFIVTLNKAHNNTANQKKNDAKNVQLVPFSIGCKFENPFLLFLYTVCLRVVFIWGLKCNWFCIMYAICFKDEQAYLNTAGIKQSWGQELHVYWNSCQQLFSG